MHDQVIYVNPKKQSQVISTAEMDSGRTRQFYDWEKKKKKKRNANRGRVKHDEQYEEVTTQNTGNKNCKLLTNTESIYKISPHSKPTIKCSHLQRTL